MDEKKNLNKTIFDLLTQPSVWFSASMWVNATKVEISSDAKSLDDEITSSSDFTFNRDFLGEEDSL